MRPGYKQTEVGVIPEDWDVLPLGGHVRITSGESPSLIQFSDEGQPYFKVEQLGNDTKYLGNDSTPYHFLRGRTVPKGSVVFAKRGAAIALNRIRIFSDDAFMDTNLMALTSVGSLDPEFIYYKLAHIGLEKFADTTSVPQINNKHINPLRFPFPLLPEQSAIATALSDVDALLSSLDALIAKKRDIKQAAMQQLLTGKTRLPGFKGEWEVKKIGEFTDCTAGGTPSTLRDDFWGGDIRWMNSGELNFRRVYEVEGRITEAGLINSSTKLIPPGCVLIGLAGQGRTRGTVAMNYVELCTNQSIAAIFPNSSFSTEYLYQNLDSRYEELRGLSSGGGGRGGLNLALIKGLDIPFPSIAEQTAIAEVLSDMDAELAALEARRAKTRLLKQGMMQELLTGKTRLV
ncbi:restriction endonuclease subunit S [Burkholderia multivorans]|uniref:restriction endonuclease subunit S n=1 Tax=Burkholderia multivorans TaxID=87883 RepID=UPI0020B3BA3B|nr:restriction endonuclease subunit S [Burkholderia multivorans]